MAVTPLPTDDPTRHTTKLPGMVTPLTGSNTNEFTLATGQIGNSAPGQPAVINPVADYTPALGEAGKSTSQAYTPRSYAVPTKGLVQTQVNEITKSGSPLMQQAERIGLEKAAQRGMVNSSIGVTAAQDSVISAALPIAQQDASAYNTAETNTVNQQNAALQFGAGAQNSASQLNAQLESSMNQANATAFNTALSAEAQAKNTRALALIDTNTKMQLAEMDVQSRALLQSSTAASQAYVQAITNISNISASNTMDQGAKDAAINTQMNLLRQQLSMLGGIASTEARAVTELNLGQYFQTTSADGGAVVPGTPGTSPYNGSIPAGGTRDAQGTVYNADGTRAGWQGPPGQPVGPGPSGGATGTVTNPSAPPNQNPGTVQPVTLAGWKFGMPLPPGYKLTNRGQLVRA